MQEKWKQWKLLWKYMKGSRLLYVGAVLSVGISALLSLIPPLVVRFVIDSVIGNEPMEVPPWAGSMIKALGGRPALLGRLWVCALVLLLITILNGVFMYTRGKWAAQASEAVARRMRESLYDHLQHLPYDAHVKAQTGDWIQRCTSDVDTVRRFLSMQLVEAGRAVFILITALVFMVMLDVRMTWVSMAVVPVIFAFSFVFFSKVKESFKNSDEAEGRMSTVLQENLTGVRVVKAFGRQAFEVEKFDQKSREYRDLSYKLTRILALFWSSSDLLGMMQMAVVLILGVYWASTGVITLGTLVVFITYEGMLLWPVRQLGRILADAGKTEISLERIGEILDMPREDMDDGGARPDIGGDIVFDGVWFEYEKGRPVLKDLSFTVKGGQTVAVLGPTGSGKSSLVHLLQRLYDYQKGSITIDGVELKDIDKRWLRKHVGIVLQEPFLFSRSIRENIRLARKEAGEAQIVEASRIAALHDVIEAFDQGYDTLVGERGVTLSGGQKQRVAIARTLIKRSSILIFDDSLSAVDTETDAAIRKALERRAKNITTFIITHRVTTAAQADLIIVLENGRVAQSGNHNSLIKEPGLYRRIWSIQSVEGE